MEEEMGTIVMPTPVDDGLPVRRNAYTCLTCLHRFSTGIPEGPARFSGVHMAPVETFGKLYLMWFLDCDRRARAKASAAAATPRAAARREPARPTRRALAIAGAGVATGSRWPQDRRHHHVY